MTTAFEEERHLARFIQNSEHFRGLNSQMWQIPIIGMTLTGGLWFGVSTAKGSPLFQICLLILALVGNVALILVLFRLRFVMKAYLEWLDNNEPKGKINADGNRPWEKSYFVRTIFQFVLGLAAAASLLLIIATAYSWYNKTKSADLSDVTAYYDARAAMLADSYGVIQFAAAHPYLAEELQASGNKSILYIGDGVIRDVEALVAMGNRVLAVSPSSQFLKVSKLAGLKEDWLLKANLPSLSAISESQKFDLVVLDGVWARISNVQRKNFMDRLFDLLKPRGKIYLTLRTGPVDPKHGGYPQSMSEVARIVSGVGAKMSEVASRPDLIGRPTVRWSAIIVEAPF